MKPLISLYQRRICVLLLQGLLVTVSIIFPVASCRTVEAAEVKIVPACELKEEFNDNIYLTTGNPKSDFITNLTPSVAISRASENLNFDLLTGLSWHKYARTEGIGKTDLQYNAQISNRFSERDDIGLSTAYTRNSRPGSVSLATGLPISTGSDHYQYSGNVKRLLDDTTSTTAAYSFVRDTYDNQDSQANQVHEASLVVAKDLSTVVPALKGTFSTIFSRAKYRDSSSDNYTMKIGISRNIHERIGVNLSAGGQLIDSTFLATTETSNKSWGAVGSASLNYSGENSFGSLSFSRNFTPASGQVGAVETSTFGLTLGRSLSEKSTAQISASYNINQASSGQFSSQSTDDRALNLRADIMYKMTKFFDAGLQYAYYKVTYTAHDQRVAQNSVILRIVAKYPTTW
jgi:hypothetical protein